MPTIADLGVEIHVEGMSRFEAGLKQATASVGKLGNDVDKASDNMQRGTADASKGFNNLGGVVKGVGGMIAAYFTADALLSIGSAIISTTANFQKMEAVLTNTLGSQSAAQNAMLMIQDIAAKTPFAVEELTASYVKLANRGIKPTSGEIIKLGDLASSTGQSFDQLTEALLDAMTGEFERLKEFGIRASSQGDKVAFTFKGVTTTVAKTDQAIKDYVLTLGDLEGVSGANAKISGTLGGKLSNLGDTFTNLFKTIGDGTNGPLSWAVDKLGELAEATRKALASNEQLAKEAAAPTISKYADNVAAAYKKIAEESKKAGQDVKAFLDSQRDADEAPLKKQLAAISKEIMRVNAQLATPAIATNAAFSADLKEDLLGYLTIQEKVKGKLESIAQAYKAVSNVSSESTFKQLGLLERLKEELSDLQDSQLKASAPGQIESINAQIYAKEEEIKKYLELGDAQRKQQQALKDLNGELQQNITLSQTLGDRYSYVDERRGILQKGLTSLAVAGFGPASEEIKKVAQELDSLPVQMDRLALSFANTDPEWVTAIQNAQKYGNALGSASMQQKAFQDALNGFKPQKVDLTTESFPLSDAELKAQEFASRMYETGNALATSLQGLAVESLSYLGATIGDIFTGSFQGLDGFFKGILGVIGEFMGQFGQQLVALGIGKLALDSLFNNPFGAIAAGVAMIALSKVVSSINSKGTSGIKPGGSGGGSYSSPTSRASTFTPSQNPLNSDPSVRIAGSDLVIVFDRAKAEMGRTG